MIMDDFLLLKWYVRGLDMREKEKKKKRKGGENNEVVKG